MTWFEKHILKERMKTLDNCEEFQRIFGTQMKPFWINNICGFDIIAFDKWLKTPNGLSMHEYVKEKFGSKGLSMVEKLLQ